MKRSTLLMTALLAACAGSSKSSDPAAGPGGDSDARPPTSEEAKQKFESAIARLNEMEKTGQIDGKELAALFKAAIKADAKLAEAHFNLGVLAENDGTADEAIKHYERALSTTPTFAPAVENLAAIFVAKDRIDEAQKILEDFIQREPAAPKPRVSLARILRLKQQHDAALEQCRAALQRDPQNLGAFQTMSSTYADMGNAPMARLVAARGFKVKGDDPRLHHTMGRLNLKDGKIPEAVLEFKRSLEADPAYRSARVDLAEVALQYRDFGNARTHYEELLKETPDDAAVWQNLGIAYKGLGAFDEALKAYEKSRAIKPGPTATLDLAMLYHRNLGKYDEALKLYQEYSKAPVKEGPPEAEIKASITELEQTIAALKEAEKMEKLMQQQALEQQQQQQAQPEGAASAPVEGQPGAEQPASAPAGG